MTDLEQLAVSLGADEHGLRRCVVAGDPVPKGRPRVTKRGHAYTPQRTRQAESDLAWCLTVDRKGPRAPEGPMVLVARFWRQTRRRVDGDNCSKLVLDAGTKAGLWADDSQVVAHATLMELDRVRPRTELVWGPKA